MALTLRETLKFGGLLESTVIAGEKGMDAVVKSVSVLEIADSSISIGAEENQLYITSFYAIWNDVEKQKTIIKNLKDNGCCGLVLCNVGLLIQYIDQSVADFCEEMGFPLIRARANVSYIEILNPIMKILCQGGDEAANSEQNLMIRNDFMNLIINEDDTYSVLRGINKILGRNITYYDIFGEPIYSDESDDTVERELEYVSSNYNHILYECRSRGFTLFDNEGKTRLFVLVRSDSNFFGFFTTDRRNNDDDERIKHLMDTVLVPCTILFRRRDRILDHDRRVRREFVTDLITGNFTTDKNARHRAADLDLEIESIDTQVIININTIHRTEDKKLQEEIQTFVERNLMSHTSRLLKLYCSTAWAEFRSDVVLVFINSRSMTGDHTTMGLCERLLELYSRCALELSVNIGISNPFTKFQDIPKAYTEAYSAAILGRRHYGTEKVVLYKEVWFFSLLRELGESEGTLEVCDFYLRDLAVYDELHGTDLVETLQVFLYNNCNVKETADILDIHKNTMLQRKNKIEEILGYSPYTMPHMLNFLMIFDILSSKKAMLLEK